MIALFRNGGPVMYPLLVCSIISLAVIIERAIFWINAGRTLKSASIDRIFRQCQTKAWDDGAYLGTDADNYVSRVLCAGIRHRDEAMVKAMESAAADELSRMRQYMGVLDTMITVSPLLGILGTVTGIIFSFEMLGTSGIENPQAVTLGIAQALITTATGLSIAICAVLPHHYFNSRIENAIRIIEKNATRLEILCMRSDQPDKGKNHEN